MKMVLSLCACLCFANSIHAQLEASQWYFGEYAGLDFRNGLASLTDGSLSTLEGSASICDREGNLLFYTDGVSVFNRLHLRMPNGSNLWGSYTTTQTLIVPKPGTDPIYYIFTASPQFDKVFGEGTDSVGFHYSIVNMELDGGLGDVSQKNVLLFKNTTEKVTAVHHANGKDVWVVGHEWDSNCFRSYMVDETGIATTPVVSCKGTEHNGSINNAAGMMKISNHGFLALVITPEKKVEIFSFDAITGEIEEVVAAITAPPFPLGVCYGLEFSSNGRLLYFSLSYWNIGCGVNIAEHPSEVWQYLIEKDKFVRVGSFTGSLNAMQLAPDGKIYISQCNDIAGESGYMAVIHNPNREGPSCNFQSNAISLNGRKNQLGLPNFIQSYFLFPDPVVAMPNVFTPNGDLYNPIFKPILFENMLEADLQIINRWGQQVFHTQDVQAGWNGGNAPSGVYYWLMRYEGKNGKTGTLKGWVHLIR